MESIQRECRVFLRALRKRYRRNLVSVVLFGSVAQGRHRPTSDIDMLLVADGLPNSRLDRRRDVYHVARNVSKEFAHRVSVIPLTSHEASDVKPFYLGMLSGHQRLFDRDDFFREVLRRLKRRLQELGSKRCVTEDGAEYWILKPDVKPGEAIVL